ncbi:hypothetical protein BC938DRAFT_475346 [Jimgerdemannia flammicorona]|uniref:Uncharacterized protein n=1 Tax=Jimgerdemannia flammicorona TaxID=994334 RepID=A0A433QRN2_9FUNG|nr:hypothetical protein BC938DRAFT_475346 [Jimgerdemannia flammicorona]
MTLWYNKYWGGRSFTVPCLISCVIFKPSPHNLTRPLQGIKERIKAELLPYLPVSDNAGDTQSRDIKFLRIPDYFTVLREPHFQRFSAWLGGEIVAKLVFPNPTNYISKVDYNESGPSVVHHKSY